eukprot:151724-Amphidinium_carterae.2
MLESETAVKRSTDSAAHLHLWNDKEWPSAPYFMQAWRPFLEAMLVSVHLSRLKNSKRVHHWEHCTLLEKSSCERQTPGLTLAFALTLLPLESSRSSSGQRQQVSAKFGRLHQGLEGGIARVRGVGGC